MEWYRRFSTEARGDIMSGVEDILMQAYDEGLYDAVMEASKSLDSNGKHYYEVKDKFEEAYNIVKEEIRNGKRNKKGKSRK